MVDRCENSKARRIQSRNWYILPPSRTHLLITNTRQFAKHMKVEEQVQFLQNHKTGICVGTPARLMDLIDNGKFNHNPNTCFPQGSLCLTRLGALCLDHLKRLVVDASHIDQKKRGVLDMKDTMMPLARFLSRKEFKDRYGDEKKPLALLFY